MLARPLVGTARCALAREGNQRTCPAMPLVSESDAEVIINKKEVLGLQVASLINGGRFKSMHDELIYAQGRGAPTQDGMDLPGNIKSLPRIEGFVNGSQFEHNPLVTMGDVITGILVRRSAQKTLHHITSYSDFVALCEERQAKLAAKQADMFVALKLREYRPAPAVPADSSSESSAESTASPQPPPVGPTSGSARQQLLGRYLDDAVAISPMVTGQAQKRDRSPQRGANMSPAVSPAHKVTKHMSASSSSSSSGALIVTSKSDDGENSADLSVSDAYVPSGPPSSCSSLTSQSTQKSGESDGLGSDDIFAVAPSEPDQCTGTDGASVTGSKSSAESEGLVTIGSQSGPMALSAAAPIGNAGHMSNSQDHNAMDCSSAVEFVPIVGQRLSVDAKYFDKDLADGENSKIGAAKDRWSYQHFGRMTKQVGWRTAIVSGLITSADAGVLTVRWDDVPGKEGRMVKELGSTQISMHERYRGHEPDIRAFVPPIIAPAPEPELDTSAGSDPAPPVQEAVVPIPVRTAPPMQDGEMSDIESIASDSGSEVFSDEEDGEPVAFAGGRSVPRGCDETAPCTLAPKKPGAGLCISCHQDKTQKYVPPATHGLPLNGRQSPLSKSDLKWCAHCAKSEPRSVELWGLYQEDWTEEERQTCPREETLGQKGFSPGYYKPPNDLPALDATLADIFISQHDPTTVKECVKKTQTSMPGAYIFSAGKYWKFWGLMFLMMHYRLPSVIDHWTDPLLKPTFDGVMSFKEFRTIKENIAYSEFQPGDVGYRENDPFSRVRKFAAQTNQQIVLVYIAGTLLTGDESMTQWRTLSCPGALTIDRKPIPNGYEWWTMCDALTKVMLYFELHEDKLGESLKQFQAVTTKLSNYDNYQTGSGATISDILADGGYRIVPPHAARVLRMTQAYWGSGRTVIIDAGFASVTAMRLLFLFGIFGFGNIKTCSKLCPRHWALGRLTKRGDTVNAVNNKFKIPLLVTGHMDKKPMLLCATAGTSNAAPDGRRRQRSRWVDGFGMCCVVYYLIHSICHHYYRAFFNTVDCHNRDRHGKCDIAEVCPTKSYQLRLVSTIPHFLAVNAYKIYNQLHPDDTVPCPYQGTRAMTTADRQFQLATELVNNRVDHVGAETRTLHTAAAAVPVLIPKAELDPDAMWRLHDPIPIPDGKRLACTACRNIAQANQIGCKSKGGSAKASHYCSCCNIVLHKGKDCHMLHIKMVRERHPGLATFNKYNPAKKKATKKPAAGGGTGRGRGRPSAVASRTGR